MTLQLHSLCKSFGKTDVVQQVDLDVESGEFIIFVGPSGCGKSTILRMIAGLEKATSGTIHIDGRDVTHLPSSQRGIAMVFQSYALYPHLSVHDNIAFSLQIARVPKDEIARRVKTAADSLQLTQYLDRLPKELSGGQRQRVAIGRAIVRDPKVFLFDEPLSNLDAALRTDMRTELAGLHQRLKSTMIYVTHDQVEAMTLADRIVVLNEGRVEQVGRPMDLYLTPQTPFVAGFIGSPKMNLIKGAAAKKLGVDMIGIRPEDVIMPRYASGAGGGAGGSGAGAGGAGSSGAGAKPRLGPGDIKIAAKIARIEQLGADTYVYTDTAGHGRILARCVGRFDTGAGEALELVLPKASMHLFRAGQRVTA